MDLCLDARSFEISSRNNNGLDVDTVRFSLTDGEGVPIKIVLTLLTAVVVCSTPLLANTPAERLDESNSVLKLSWMHLIRYPSSVSLLDT